MGNIRVLLVEDEDHLREITSKYLNKNGFEVFEAQDGEEAIDLWIEEHIDVVLLDIMLPGINGWEVLEYIRKESYVPVIMLTAKGDVDDKIHGFDLGIDDYVTKPFSMKELIARIKALLKRTGQINNDIIEIDIIRIDIKLRKLFVNNMEVLISPKEYELMLYFINNKNIALSREKILDRFWGVEFNGDTRAVDTAIKRIRKKLGAAGKLIKTVRGLGYCFEVK